MYIEYNCKVCGRLRKEKEEIANKNNFVCRYCRANESRKKTNLQKYGVENSFLRKDIQEKIKQKHLENFGTENPLSSKKMQEKLKQI